MKMDTASTVEYMMHAMQQNIRDYILHVEGKVLFLE